MAERFESLVRADNRFEIPAKRHLGLVVFRLVGDNVITETLWKRLNSRGRIHCVPASLKGKYVIRFTVTSPRTTMDDIITDWKEIATVATLVLKDLVNEKRQKVPLGGKKFNIIICRYAYSEAYKLYYTIVLFKILGKRTRTLAQVYFSLILLCRRK